MSDVLFNNPATLRVMKVSARQILSRPVFHACLAVLAITMKSSLPIATEFLTNACDLNSEFQRNKTHLASIMKNHLRTEQHVHFHTAEKFPAPENEDCIDTFPIL